MENTKAKIKILVIDNYDSFTYNLVHFLGELGAELEVMRNDKITLEEIRNKAPQAIVLSPGPCTPTEAGICVELIKRFKAEMPIFGVCLGMQSIAQAFGGEIIGAKTQMHGKTSKISHQNKSIFRGIDNDFIATRYHSLMVEKSTLPNELEIIASTNDGTIMGLQHKTYPIYGVQFHPESIASENGHKLLDNFINLALKFNENKS